MECQKALAHLVDIVRHSRILQYPWVKKGKSILYKQMHGDIKQKQTKNTNKKDKKEVEARQKDYYKCTKLSGRNGTSTSSKEKTTNKQFSFLCRQ